MPAPPNNSPTLPPPLRALDRIYSQATGFLSEQFPEAMDNAAPEPDQASTRDPVHHLHYAQVDFALSFGHVPSPGTFSATITRPGTVSKLLTQQIGLLN